VSSDDCAVPRYWPTSMETVPNCRAYTDRGTRSRGQGRGAMPAAWAQRDDLLQVEGKVRRPGSIAGTSRVVKIECRRQGWADGHYDRLPGWLPIWSATTSPLSQRRFRPRRRLRCRRTQGPIQFLENNPIQSSLWVRFMCPKTRRNWLRLSIVRFHPGSKCPQQPP
jgi:hypothetical protein